MSITDWTQATQAVAATVQAVVVVVALVYAFFQVQEARRARRSAAALYLVQQVNDYSASVRRRTLYDEIVTRIDAPTTEDARILGQIANEYHTLGYLVKNKIVDRELVLGLQHIAVVRAWTTMEPWIMAERQRRGVAFANHFEDLVLDARAYAAVIPAPHP